MTHKPTPRYSRLTHNPQNINVAVGTLQKGASHQSSEACLVKFFDRLSLDPLRGSERKFD